MIVGHSIGGMTGLELAARRPSRPLIGIATSGMGSRIAPGSRSQTALEAAHATYAPTPFVELVQAPRWARSRLREVAARVAVPVHNVLAEHDALWDSSPEARAEFASLFSTPVTVELAPGVGHSIDHHLCSARLHLAQLAFAYACT